VIEKLSMSLIAKKMNRSKSTISRELKRNIDEMTKNYFPDTAKEKMKARRKQAKEKFKNTSLETIEQIKTRLEKYHSPE